MQYELQGREGMRALEMNRTPNLRAGMAPIATSARVAAAIVGLPPVPPDAAAVMTGAAAAPAAAPAVVPGGGAGVSGEGGSTGSGGDKKTQRARSRSVTPGNTNRPKQKGDSSAAVS